MGAASLRPASRLAAKRPVRRCGGLAAWVPDVGADRAQNAGGKGVVRAVGLRGGALARRTPSP